MVEATQMQFDKGRACTCDLLAEPYERTSTIVTSNLDFTEWGEACPNKLLGAAILRFN